jgi:hypothetical protein
MESEIRRKIDICSRAQNAEWAEAVAAANNLNASQRAFLHEHPPGMVKALWNHFDATRGRCGCASPTHERRECTVPLIERLLRDEQAA